MKEEKIKYLILFLIPDPFCTQICHIMDEVTSATGIPPLYRSLPPHLTILRSVLDIDADILKDRVKRVVPRMRQTTIRLDGLSHFGKQFIVLPVLSTRSVASLYVDVDNLLSRIPEYEPGEYNDANSFHVTVADRTSHVFDTAWPNIRKIEVDPMTFSLQEIALYQKPMVGGVWTQICTFAIPK